jgi:hypothetical protein
MPDKLIIPEYDEDMVMRIIDLQLQRRLLHGVNPHVFLVRP